MIQPGPSTRRRGQILVVEVETDTVIVDCMLCRDDDPTGILATLRVRAKGKTAASVAELLRRLAAHRHAGRRAAVRRPPGSTSRDLLRNPEAGVGAG